MLALYRSYFLYGGCRIFAWFIWSRLSVRAPLDLSWGGPYFVTPVSFPPETWAGFLLHSVVGVGGLALLLFLGWRLLGAQLWARCRTG